MWSPLLCFNIKRLKDPKSLPFTRFQCILHDSVVLLSVFEIFLKLKMGDLISWEEPMVQNGWITFSPLLYFNIKLLKDPNSLSYIRFQCILHDSAVLLSVFENFLKLKRWDQISLGELILENAWIIRSALLYFNIKRLKEGGGGGPNFFGGTNSAERLKNFDAFYMMQQYFFQF